MYLFSLSAHVRAHTQAHAKSYAKLVFECLRFYFQSLQILRNVRFGKYTEFCLNNICDKYF